MARQQRQFPQGKYILRTPRKSQNGQVYAVYLYYYWLGKQVRRSVDLTVALKDWNQDANGGAGEFRPSYGPNYKERNAYLKELMHDIDSKIMDYIKQHGEIDGETIEAFVSGDDKVIRADNGIDFIEFAKQRFIDRYNSGKIGVSSRENGISYMNLFVNGKSLGKGAQSYRYLHTFNNVAYEPGIIEAVGSDGSRYKMETAGEPFALKLTAIENPEGMKDRSETLINKGIYEV